MSAVAGVLLTAAVTPVVAVSGMTAKSAIELFESLPEHLDPGQLAEPSTIYAKDGEGNNVEVAQFYSQDRETVEWDGISQFAKDAAVAEEDPRFYTHGGVDVLAASRAALQNVAGTGFSGASTITMQYVRNVLIQEAEAISDPEESDRAYEDAMRQDMDRKLMEMRYAVSIEKQFSKDEILLGYLNIALFGRQIYGIESAANYYFNKSAKDLTLAEAASLVATVNNPSELQIDIPDNIPANQDRRDKIIGSMLREGKITQEQHDEAIATDVTPQITPRIAGCSIAETRLGLGHFCNYVQLYIKNDPSFGNTPAEREFNFMRGGFDIYTTIDLDMQQAAVSSIQGTVPATMDGIDAGAAAVSTEVGTGRVLAMAQNRPFSDDPNVLDANPGFTSVNYNTDFEYGGSGGFQIGSTFKAVTLAEWIRTGHSVRDVVNVNGRSVNSNTFQARCMPDGVYGYDTWSFTNDNMGTRGNQSVLTAVAQSVNGGLVSMQQRMDLCDTMKMAEDLGIQRASNLPASPDDPNVPYVPTLNGGFRDLSMVPSNVYGGIDEIAPMTMSTAYGAFAGDGTVCTPVPIDSIQGPNGEDVSFTKSQCRNAISPEVAAGVAYALEYTVNSGLATHARSASGIPHLAKTGTTDDVVDNWTVGASTEVSTAVWVGNASGKVSTQLFGGLMYADQTIWPSVMNVADAKYGGTAFPEPSQTAIQQTMVQVPDVTGQTFEDASEMLTSAGFSVVDGGEVDSDEAEGRVARTDPAAGSSVGMGTGITVYRSNGDGATIPEDLVGMTGNEARSALQSEGFSNITLRCETGSGNTGRATVVSVNPSPGEVANRDSQVTVRVDCE